jgi:predicted Rossmann fold flavoprotein
MILAVIGGGAAGMMAALTAAQAGADVLLLERQARVGRKLAATGNGRCNLSNRHASAQHYHGGDPAFVRPALEAFGVPETLSFFRSLGLLTVTEADGRIYPFSDTANSAVDVLRFACEAAGVRLLAGAAVTALRRQGRGFLLETEGESVRAGRVIVACGGAAGAKVGGGTWGYRLLRGLGHGVTPLRPSLVQLRVAEPIVRGLKGVRADGRVRILKDETVLAESAGEIQFTEYGLSGPAVFEISRAAEAGTVASLDLLRDYDGAEVLSMLRARREACPGLTLADLFTGMVQNRLGRVLVRYAGERETEILRDVSDAVLGCLARAAGDLRFTVTGNQGFEGAQVTAGGARTEEFDPGTMESRLVPGLFACGEVLDVDGECGGFNLQWAWSSGRAAGLAAGREPC